MAWIKNIEGEIEIGKGINQGFNKWEKSLNERFSLIKNKNK